MLVRLTQNTAPYGRRFASLTIGQVYVVIGIEADDYRILNDCNDPCLYDPVCFEVVDATKPEFWQCEVGAEGERYYYPPEICQPGFFEDYHDGVPEAVAQFHAVYQRLYANVFSRRANGWGLDEITECKELDFGKESFNVNSL